MRLCPFPCASAATRAASLPCRVLTAAPRHLPRRVRKKLAGQLAKHHPQLLDAALQMTPETLLKASVGAAAGKVAALGAC